MSYRVSWELHRTAGMVYPVAEAVNRADEIEAMIAYDASDFPLAPVRSTAQDHGPSL